MTTKALLAPFDVEEVPSKSRFAKDGKGYSITDAEGTNFYTLSGKWASILRTRGEPIKLVFKDDGNGLYLDVKATNEFHETGGGGSVSGAVGADPAVTFDSGTGAEVVGGDGRTQGTGASPAAAINPPAPVPEPSDMDLRIARGVAVKAAAGFMGGLRFAPDVDVDMGWYRDVFWQLVDDIVDYQFSGLVPGGAAESPAGAQGLSDPAPPVPDSVSTTIRPPPPDKEAVLAAAESALGKAGLICNHENTKPSPNPKMRSRGWVVCQNPGCREAFRA